MPDMCGRHCGMVCLVGVVGHGMPGRCGRHGGMVCLVGVVGMVAWYAW